MDFESTWGNICRQLCPRDDELVVEVNLALSDPESYFEKYSDDLMERGIEDPSEVTPWIALVDGLTRSASLVELDWKFDAADLVWNLEQLQICKANAIDFSKINESDEYSEDLFKLVAIVLDSYSMNLIILDIDSDSYPLMVIPRDSVGQVKRSAQALMQKVDVIERT
ncbi:MULTISPECIES: DUF6630 family protein [unclassified Halomonas]|uniref:DUF6630 family protein n=1 Tax=unclassified Halomonas TaxID=2609666 RepID=UPI0005529FF4|nr:MULTISPECIES: DUF6630 family protein [unclassified Halomonas]CEP36454.1 Putative uncharacterized protein [Halomonas sp. R57-5]